MTDWRLESVVEGWGCENSTEFPVYGVEIGPGEGDEYRKASLSMKEAVIYLNILEGSMQAVIDGHESSDDLGDSIEKMKELLTSDAWTRVRKHQRKAKSHGTNA